LTRTYYGDAKGDEIYAHHMTSREYADTTNTEPYYSPPPLELQGDDAEILHRLHSERSPILNVMIANHLTTPEAHNPTSKTTTIMEEAEKRCIVCGGSSAPCRKSPNECPFVFIVHNSPPAQNPAARSAGPIFLLSFAKVAALQEEGFIEELIRRAHQHGALRNATDTELEKFREAVMEAKVRIAERGRAYQQQRQQQQGRGGRQWQGGSQHNWQGGRGRFGSPRPSFGNNRQGDSRGPPFHFTANRGSQDARGMHAGPPGSQQNL